MNAIRRLRQLVLGGLTLGASLLAAGSVSADTDPGLHAGRANVYQTMSPDSLERTSTPDSILNLGSGNVAPTEIWRVLEHGERVECLDCIPVVSRLLWAEQGKTREISAWWLRRRIFGVFGPGEIYSQVIATIGDASQSEARRVYAANALGEFLAGSGVSHLSKAVRSDSSPRVRAAAVAGLERLNSQGEAGEVALAMSDADESVRMQALFSAIHVNVFTGVDAVAARISDASPLVRRRAAEALGVFRSSDALAGLVALSSPQSEPDSDVRKAAVTALGQIGDASAKPAIAVAASDPDGFVRDAARIASRRLGGGF